ncbi:arrestin domain-containing protein 1-like [Lampris incognitus]|uniref:arrestin domain-containing protein 1-like n=1 Tax=Lampris incognitus TaxID=2546036 RepID=UPI0024B5306C|nr:arrestin domain-containing protein 1-like [Lampris incognitus]
MGKVKEVEITFDSNKVVYSPGESISGTLKLQVAQSLHCKDIKVNCNGFCGITHKVNDTAWTTEEKYFNSTISLVDKGTLKQGDHCFPFKFVIPASAPTSFEGNYGKIIYRVRACVDTPRFAKDYKAEKPFYLLRLLNLNELPDMLGPNSSAVTRQFTYLLVKTGTVVLKAETDMKGYTPGQVIMLTANIHNQSGKTTGSVAASLIQRVTYETKKPTHDLRTIAEVEGAGVKADKEAQWKEQIIVPPLPQSSLSGCDLIRIEYYVKVSLKSPEVMLTLPIHIGNVSLDKRVHTSTTPAPSTPAPSGTPNSALVTAPQSPQTPPLPPRPVPKPAPRPAARSRVPVHSLPSAPPAEDQQGAVGGMGSMGSQSDAINTKSHSQLSASGPHTAISPSAFSYAPGLIFSQNQQHNGDPNEPLFCVSTGSTIPFFSESSATPMPTSSPLILPPDYSTSAYPQEAPPSYDDSCNT